jgi:hypothetical protein
MIERGPGYLDVVRFGSSPTPSPVSKLDQKTRKTEKERQLADGRWGRGWGGAKSYDGEKAWSSINHSILPGIG